jgi:hypothetical protein
MGEGLPDYNPSRDLANDTNIWDWISYYKYQLDVWLIGFPFTIIACLGLGWNLFFNIDWNKGWAGGNYWLIANTIWAVISFIASVCEAFELPIYLRGFKETRTFILFGSIIYVLAFFIVLFEWYDMLYLVTDKSEYDFLTVYFNMLLGYNIVMHFSIIPMNLMIIFKEITMEWF